MINEDIIRLAANTSNVGLKNKYSYKASLKNSFCGDKITLELVANNQKIYSMKYVTESCVYCEASASLLSKIIKNITLSEVKKDIKIIKKIENNKNINIPRKFLAFKKLFKSDNFNRFKCIFLPFDAVLKALK